MVSPVIENVYREIGGELTRLLERFGYTHSVAKVLSILMVSPKPLSMSEIRKLSGLSLGSISMAIKRLESEGLITYIKKGRTKFFKVMKGLPYILKIVLSRLLSVDELKIIENKAEYLIMKGHDYLKTLASDIKHLTSYLEK